MCVCGVSNRSAWEDVLSVKTKVDLLLECYYKVLSNRNRRDAPSAPSLLGQQEEGRDACPAPGSHEKAGEQRALCEEEFGYSSVRDWDTLMDMELRRSFKQWEEEYLTEIRQTLVPVISQYVGGAEPCKQDRHTVVSMLRVACLASDIPTKPIYLDTGT